jgi:hypothetical protein
VTVRASPRRAEPVTVMRAGVLALANQAGLLTLLATWRHPALAR